LYPLARRIRGKILGIRGIDQVVAATAAADVSGFERGPEKFAWIVAICQAPHHLCRARVALRKIEPPQERLGNTLHAYGHEAGDGEGLNSATTNRNVLEATGAISGDKKAALVAALEHIPYAACALGEATDLATDKQLCVIVVWLLGGVSQTTSLTNIQEVAEGGAGSSYDLAVATLRGYGILQKAGDLQ